MSEKEMQTLTRIKDSIDQMHKQGRYEDLAYIIGVIDGMQMKANGKEDTE